MPRLMLTDEIWSKLRMIIIQFNIYDKPSLRQTVEGISGLAYNNYLKNKYHGKDRTSWD